MKDVSEGDVYPNHLEISGDAEACLRGQISCRELQRRIFPKLRRIGLDRRKVGESQAEPESASAGETTLVQQPSKERFASESKLCEKDIANSLVTLVKILDGPNDPLRSIYILGAQVFDDFQELVSDAEYDKLFVFKEMAYEQALLVDEDPELNSAAADDLRRRIREAVVNYLRAADLGS